MSEVLVLPTEEPSLTLRQLATEEDDKAYYDSVIASREHLMPFESVTVMKYPTLESVTAARVDPLNPNKLRMGIWHNENTFVGSINLLPGANEAEIGYWLDVRHTGHGYATFASKALAGYAAERHQRVFATVDPENIASQKVLERSGFEQTSEQFGKKVFELITHIPSFETHLTRWEIDRPERVEKYGVSPEQASDFLTKLGYTPTDWDMLYENSSHELKTLVIIACGNQKRMEWVIRQNLRKQENDPNVVFGESLQPPKQAEPF